MKVKKKKYIKNRIDKIDVDKLATVPIDLKVLNNVSNNFVK